MHTIIIISLKKVFIDSNGDSEGNYTVASMQKHSYGDSVSYLMQPVGYFQYNTSVTTSPLDLPVSHYYILFTAVSIENLFSSLPWLYERRCFTTSIKSAQSNG